MLEGLLQLGASRLDMELWGHCFFKSTHLIQDYEKFIKVWFKLRPSRLFDTGSRQASRLLGVVDKEEVHEHLRRHECDGDARSSDQDATAMSMRRSRGFSADGSAADAFNEYGLCPRVRDDPRPGIITSRSRSLNHKIIPLSNRRPNQRIGIKLPFLRAKSRKLTPKSYDLGASVNSFAINVTPPPYPTHSAAAPNSAPPRSASGDAR
jgi:hypothetical protein